MRKNLFWIYLFLSELDILLIGFFMQKYLWYIPPTMICTLLLFLLFEIFLTASFFDDELAKKRKTIFWLFLFDLGFFAAYWFSFPLKGGSSDILFAWLGILLFVKIPLLLRKTKFRCSRLYVFLYSAMEISFIASAAFRLISKTGEYSNHVVFEKMESYSLVAFYLMLLSFLAICFMNYIDKNALKVKVKTILLFALNFVFLFVWDPACSKYVQNLFDKYTSDKVVYKAEITVTPPEEKILFIAKDAEKSSLLDKNGEAVETTSKAYDFFTEQNYTVLLENKNSFILLGNENSLCHVVKNSVGIYAFKEKERYGFKTLDDMTVFQPEFEEILPFTDFRDTTKEQMAIAAAKKDGKWAFINNYGSVLTSFEFDKISPFVNRFTIVQKEEKEILMTAYLEKRMEFEQRKKIKNVTGVHGSMIILDFGPDTPSLYIHYYGQNRILVDEKRNYRKIYATENDFLRVMTQKEEGNKFGFITVVGGDEVIPCVYDMAGDFIYNLAPVKTKNRWSLINQNGNAQIPFIEVENIEVVDGQTALLTKLNGKYFLLKINTMKEQELLYKKITVHHNPDLLVGEKEDGKKDLLNVEGKPIFSHSFDNISAFQKQRAIAVFENRQQIIDDQGNVVKEFPGDVDITFINKLPICE